MIAVAISTTGDEHRLPLLKQSVEAWRQVLPLGCPLFVTVDGDERKADAVLKTVRGGFGAVARVGQPEDTSRLRGGRLGVAANKNTGMELMLATGAEHLFLCDDDTWPLESGALLLHTNHPVLRHSMVCWGPSRLVGARKSVAEWTWPRGVLMYAHRTVIGQVGGFDERFGPGGHEHVEWSRRIHQKGLTPVLFPTPRPYALDRGRAAREYWHAEDAPRRGEAAVATAQRKAGLTSVRRKPGDWDKIEAVLAERDGDTSYVPYDPVYWGRSSATLITGN